MNKTTYAQKFQLFNNIDEFRPFQDKIYNRLIDDKRTCIVTCSGSGKTTMQKYLAFDFIDFNVRNRVIIFVNTRMLSADIEDSMLEVLESENKKLVCNLCNFSIDNPITSSVIADAKIFITTPGKFMHVMNKVGLNFTFVCVDEVDALLDNKNSVDESNILTILRRVKYQYILLSTATNNAYVKEYILDKYKISTIEDDSYVMPIIQFFKMRYRKKDKDWPLTVCDKIFFILESNPLHKKSVVFCNTKEDCDKLYNEYSGSAREKYYCYGDFSFHDLKTALFNFKEYGSILFTTDMFHRGINIPEIKNVFHVGVTSEETFYHRNGRAIRVANSDAHCYVFYDIHSSTSPILQGKNELEF